ncbi:MAG TPA: ABC transporter ATP-binding protein [Candidatus Pygmaiobacter gallistercoris]|nr:ABC transporter ATP-binding protein [Candidatus Pygmaiobacter gallistercoris]
MAAVIEAHQLSHRYADHTVLRQVSFAVEQGEIFGLLGPSGAGKTTLVRILTGQLLQTGGEAALLGRDTRRLTGAEHRAVGAMMDDLGLYERFSVWENLAFYARLYRVEREDIGDLLRRCGLYEARRTPAGRLSKGMRSRLALARALLGKPKLLFLDEPTAGLDPGTARRIWALLEKARADGLTILLTTHNMVEAQRLCDRVALLHGGEILELGAPDAICQKYNRQNRFRITLRGGETVELENSPASVPTLCSYLETGRIASIHSSEPTLEEVFLKRTGRGLQEE